MSITVKDLCKTIDHKPVLEAIAFTWQPGEIIALVGRNGVGKTTLMRTMVDQYHPDTGKILVGDADLNTQPTKRSDVFYLDTEALFFKRWRLPEIGAVIAMAYPQFDSEQFQQLLAVHGLATQRYQHLSKGYQALVRISLAIASNALYILLDEPFDGLDVIVRRQIVGLVIDTVASGEHGIMIASRDLDELDGLAGRVLMLKHTQLVEDVRLEDLRERAVKLQLVFPTKTLPPVIKAAGRILSVQGRVVAVVAGVIALGVAYWHKRQQA